MQQGEMSVKQDKWDYCQSHGRGECQPQLSLTDCVALGHAQQSLAWLCVRQHTGNGMLTSVDPSHLPCDNAPPCNDATGVLLRICRV